MHGGDQRIQSAVVGGEKGEQERKGQKQGGVDQPPQLLPAFGHGITETAIRYVIGILACFFSHGSLGMLNFTPKKRKRHKTRRFVSASMPASCG